MSIKTNSKAEENCIKLSEEDPAWKHEILDLLQEGANGFYDNYAEAVSTFLRHSENYKDEFCDVIESFILKRLGEV